MLNLKAPRRIAIVGGGATGVIAACQLMDRFLKDLVLDLYEPGEILGAGVAYGAQDPALILNVPFTRMNYDPKKLGDFESYLKAHHPEAFKSKEFPYVQRSYYRQYLQTRLQEREKLSTWKHCRERVLDVRSTAQAVIVETASGLCEYEQVFIASGYERQLPFTGEGGSRIISCFDEEAVQRIPDQSRILLAGMGLSAVDVLRLLRNKKNLQISAVSRRGRWPIAHLQSPKGLSQKWSDLSPTKVLRQARELRRRGEEWADIADSFRVEVQTHWQSWTGREKKMFITHLRPLWEIVRHRLPPGVGVDLQEALKLGALRNIRAGVQSMVDEGSSVQVKLRYYGESSARDENFDYAVVAMGARVNEMFLKASTDARVHLLGPASKSLHWEITAIPEIAEQVANQVNVLDSTGNFSDK